MTARLSCGDLGNQVCKGGHDRNLLATEEPLFYVAHSFNSGSEEFELVCILSDEDECRRYGEEELKKPWRQGVWSVQRLPMSVIHGMVLGNALKSLSIDRLELKGDAELHELREKVIAQQARIEQLKHALSVGWSPYYINGIDARKLADEALAIPDDLSALRAHDAKLLAPYQWQPIETAPKDGEVILVSHIFNDKIYWVEAAKQKYGAWFRPTGHAVRQPTHWMPLPSVDAIEKGNVR